jgi:hypothetical protein
VNSAGLAAGSDRIFCCGLARSNEFGGGGHEVSRRPTHNCVR